MKGLQNRPSSLLLTWVKVSCEHNFRPIIFCYVKLPTINKAATIPLDLSSMPLKQPWKGSTAISIHRPR